MDRVTADSNVLVSALRYGGKPLALLNLAQDGQIELALSDDILAETLRVLARPKFGWTPKPVAEAGTFLRAITTRVSPAETLDIVKADPTDNKVLECAVAAGSEVIVSGDAHLLSLGEFRGVKIMRVADFLLQGRAR